MTLRKQIILVKLRRQTLASAVEVLNLEGYPLAAGTLKSIMARMDDELTTMKRRQEILKDSERVTPP